MILRSSCQAFVSYCLTRVVKFITELEDFREKNIGVNVRPHYAVI